MNEKVNVQAKKQLAKLLATENITVVHAGTKTATFDPKRRILTLPIWKDMSGDLYDLLVLHEVGHALFTPPGSKPLIDACNYIDPLHPKAAKGFVNVVEDARIERLIKNMYPGARAPFIRGYKELIERNFFRTRGRDLSKMGIIDRINIHFKTGSEFDIPFTDEEMEFVKRIQEALTFTDVVDISKDLYVYAKKERAEKKKQEQKELEELEQELEDQLPGASSRMRSSEEGDEEDDTLDPDADDSEDLPEDDSDGDLETDDDDSDDEEEGDENGSEEDDSDSDEEEGDGSDQDGKDDGDDEEEADDDPEKDGSGSKEGDDSEDRPPEPKEEDSVDDTPIESETDEAWNENQDDLRDKDAKAIQYLGIPEPRLDKIIVGYKQVHEDIRKFYTLFDAKHGTALVPQHMGEFERFKQENKPVVAWLVKEFEMNKAADQYARTSVAKTGALDLNRLHEYKISDDIMKRNAIVPGGKNHANLLFLDYSGSMREHLMGSIHQLINLAMFHRKVNTNFRAFTFGAMTPRTALGIYNRGEANTECFVHKQDDFTFYDGFVLREILSSRMNAREFNEACVNLMLIASGASRSEWGASRTGNHYGQLPATDQLGATPLNEAIVTAIPLVKQMYKAGAQFVHVTFITDGEATTGGYYCRNDFGNSEPLNHNDKQIFLRDTENHVDYPLPMDSIGVTDTFLKIFRAKTKSTAVGFFISGADGEIDKACRLFMSKGGVLTVEKLEEYKKEMDKNFFLVAKETGYTEFYILPSGKKLKINQATSPLSGALTNAQMVTAMTDHGLMQRKQRVLLTRYIKLIS